MFVQQFNNSIWRGEKKNGTKAKTIWQVGEWWHYNIPCICARHTHHNCTHAIVCECMRACVPGAPSNFIWLFHMLNHQCHCRFSRYLQHQAVPERGVQTHSPSPVLCIRSWTAYCVLCMCGHRMSRGSYLHLVNLLATVHTESSMYRCACERRRKRSPRRDEQTVTNGKHTHRQIRVKFIDRYLDARSIAQLQERKKNSSTQTHPKRAYIWELHMHKSHCMGCTGITIT